jgi:hypothetical protein
MRVALAKATRAAAPARSRITTSIAAIPRAPTMPPPVPAAALVTRQIAAAAAAAPPEEEAAATLAWRMSNGSWWRRLVAWARHGAWRWRTT